MKDKLHPLWEYFLWDENVDKVDFDLPNTELIGMNDFAKKLAIRERFLLQKRIIEQRTHYRLLKRIIKEVDILVLRQNLRLKKTAKGYEEKRYWKVREDGNIDIILRVGAKEVFLNGMKGIRFVLPPDWKEVLRFLVDFRDILKLGEEDEEFWEYDKIQLIKDAKKTFRLGYEERKRRALMDDYDDRLRNMQKHWEEENKRWNKYMVEYAEKQKANQLHNKENTINTIEDLFK